MPRREIEIPILPKPNVPNNQGIMFSKEILDTAIQKYMEGNSQHVMLQREHQTGDMKADVELDKICGYVTEIKFDKKENQYLATVKFIPNKNSAFVFSSIKEGIKFSLGTNKVGNIRKTTEKDELPEEVKYIPNDNIEILSTSLLPDWVTE